MGIIIWGIVFFVGMNTPRLWPAGVSIVVGVAGSLELLGLVIAGSNPAYDHTALLSPAAIAYTLAIKLVLAAFFFLAGWGVRRFRQRTR